MTMNEPRECPECGSMNTTRQWSEFEMYQVFEIRTCDGPGCVTEYQVTYADPMIEVTHSGDA